jgi:DNA replication protein DnaC
MTGFVAAANLDADAEKPPLACDRCGVEREFRTHVFGKGEPGYGMPPVRAWVLMCGCYKAAVEDGWFPDRQQANMTFQTVHPSLKDQRLMVEVSLKRNSWLVMHGGVGTGKTYLARCAVNSRLDQGRESQLITWASMLLKIRATYDPGSSTNEWAIIKRAIALDLLVIDDFGAQHSSHDFSNHKLQDIVDGRDREGRMTIITTNLNQEELAANMDPRTVDRIAAQAAFLTFEGVNLRQEAGRDAKSEW